MKYPKLSKGYSVRGAQMGRQSTMIEYEQTIKFHLYLMPMSPCGCYDNGGAYWGAGDEKIGWMWHAYGEGERFRNEMFIRATSREDAKEQVRGIFNKARFYR